MAVPGADVGVVHPVAAGVTKPHLLSFRRFMRLPRTLGLAPVAALMAVAASSIFLISHAPIARAQCGSNASAPACPTPVHAFLSLDVTAGDANTVINVSGGQFLPNEPVSLYWDSQNKVAGSATADASGSFNTRVKPFSGDAPGQHKLCASVDPFPCALFMINAPPTTPSPSASPPESPSPSPAGTTTAAPTPTPVGATLNGFDVISKPPFVFLPIAGVVAIGLALAFWLYSVVRRPRAVALPSAAVVHRAMRPDYSAGFGAAPQATAASPEPSAWDDRPVPRPTLQPAPEPSGPAAPPPPSAASEVESAEWGPPVEWGTDSKDWGIADPPRVDEDLPDPPQPGD